MRAFSLVELLVTILVIVLLLAILIPSLAGVRRAGTRLNCEHNMRECLLAINSYSLDNGDMFPMFAERQPQDAFSNGGFLLPYFLQRIHWPLVVRPYLTDQRLAEVQLCPNSPAAREAFSGDGSYNDYLEQYPSSYTQPSEYWLSYTLFTAPEMWQKGGRVDDESLLRAVRISEVFFPSEKGALVEARAYHLPQRNGKPPEIVGKSPSEGPFVIGFADGHVKSLQYSTLTPGFSENGINPRSAAPVVATPDGAQGRDIRR